MLIKRPIDDALAPLLTQAGSAAPRADEPHPPVPGGRYVPAPSLRPVPSFTPTQPPQPADEVELDQLRYGLRAAQLKVVQESDRLNGLQRARVRARSERYGAIERFAEAERVLADAKRHGRAHLVALYVDGKELVGPTPENAEHERNLRADQVRSAETLILRPSTGRSTAARLASSGTAVAGTKLPGQWSRAAANFCVCSTTSRQPSRRAQCPPRDPRSQ